MNEWNLATADLCGPHTYEEPAPFCDRNQSSIEPKPVKIEPRARFLAGVRKMLRKKMKNQKKDV